MKRTVKIVKSILVFYGLSCCVLALGVLFLYIVQQRKILESECKSEFSVLSRYYRRYKGCLPVDVRKKEKELINQLREETASLANIIFVTKEDINVSDSQLLFMQQIRNLEQVLKQKYGTGKFPENLGFPIQMPEEAEVANFVYLFGIIKRVVPVALDSGGQIKDIEIYRKDKVGCKIVIIGTMKVCLRVLSSLIDKPVILLSSLEMKPYEEAGMLIMSLGFNVEEKEMIVK